jgi:hypothetical protein
MEEMLMRRRLGEAAEAVEAAEAGVVLGGLEMDA